MVRDVRGLAVNTVLEMKTPATTSMEAVNWDVILAECVTGTDREALHQLLADNRRHLYCP